MALRNLLRRAGAASPLVPAVTYGGILAVATLLIALAPENAAVALLAFLAWLAAALFLFVVVTWYRDDDWLAAGFLIGLSLLLGGLAADLVTRTVQTRSLGEAVFSSASASMALLVRALILVPVCGGVVAGARWITRAVRKRSASESGAPPVIANPEPPPVKRGRYS
jgi:hypothetical protein